MKEHETNQKTAALASTASGCYAPLGFKIKEIFEQKYESDSDEFITCLLLARYGEIFVDDEKELKNGYYTKIFDKLKQCGIGYKTKRINRVRVTPIDLGV